MSEYKLKNGKIGDAVVGAYKKVEDAFVDAFLEKSEDGQNIGGLKTGKVGDDVVGAYKAVEDTVVSGYHKVENAFVKTFREKSDDSESDGQGSDKVE